MKNLFNRIKSLYARKVLFSFLIFEVAAVLVIIFLIANNNQKNNQPHFNNFSSERIINSAVSPAPTPIPFYDITIPYLREREYRSSLGDLEKAYESVSYTAYVTSYDSDGLKISGLLTIPREDPSQVSPDQDNSRKYPAIVFVHGYIPPSSYQTTQNYYDYVDFLARSGFVVFKIDLRGHGNSEGEPGGAYYSSDYIIDTLNAYAALQSAQFVDSKKIGLWGHSMAGNVVMRSFAVQPDIPAVVIFAGAVYSYTDFREYGISDASYQAPQMSSERVRRRQRLLDTYGQPSKESVFWQQVAPTNYLSDLKGAIQIHHAVNDPVVSIEYSRSLMSLLNSTPVKRELYEYPSGGHNLTGLSFTQSMQRTVDFFTNNL